MRLETLKRNSPREDVMPIIDYFELLYQYTNNEYYRERINTLNEILKQMENLNENVQE